MALGGRTIAEWQQVMSAEEFVDWQLYFQMNPFGQKRADYQAALVASVIANANAAKGQKFSVNDFVLSFKSKVGMTDSEAPKMSSEKVVSFFQSLQQGRA